MKEFANSSELLEELKLAVVEGDLSKDIDKQLNLITTAESEYVKDEEAEGAVRVLVGEHHIALSRSGWALLKLLIEIYIAAHQQSGLDAGRALLEFFLKVRKLIQKLTPSERLAYAAVAGVCKSKELLGKSEKKGASIESLRTRFIQEEKEPPRTLEKDLERMAEDKEVLRKFDEDGTTRYENVF